MAEEIHPGSFVGDSIEEFKKLPTWGKFAIGGIAILVVYLGIRAYMSKGNASGGIASGNLEPTNNVAGSQSPFPTVSSGGTNVPLLPSNVNPVYDQQGGLVGYQNAPTPPAQVGATPNPPNSPSPFSGFFGLIGANAKVNIAKSGLASDSTYVNAQGQTVPLSGLISGTDKVVQGSNNRVWYTDSGGQHLLTSGSGPAIDPRTNTPYVAPPAQGAGGISWQSRIRRLTHYTPQYGDNMNEIATKLGLTSWQDFGIDHFVHGESIAIPRG